jgi:hypothetical protein
MKPGCAILTMSRIPKEIETPDGHGRIEAAEQQARRQCVYQEIGRHVHAAPRAGLGSGQKARGREHRGAGASTRRPTHGRDFAWQNSACASPTSRDFAARIAAQVARERRSLGLLRAVCRKVKRLASLKHLPAGLLAEAWPASATRSATPLRRCAPSCGIGSGLLALARNSTVMNTSSLSPIFSRSCTLYSPGP